MPTVCSTCSEQTERPFAGKSINDYKTVRIKRKEGSSGDPESPLGSLLMFFVGDPTSMPEITLQDIAGVSGFDLEKCWGSGRVKAAQSPSSFSHGVGSSTVPASVHVKRHGYTSRRL